MTCRSYRFTQDVFALNNYLFEWRCPLHWTLDSGSKGWGFDSHQCLALLSFSKTLYPHCCSPSTWPRCINGYLVGCEWYLSLDVACVRPWSGACPECSPRSWEGSLWVLDWFLIQLQGIIVHCKALWVLSDTKKVLYLILISILKYHWCFSAGLPLIILWRCGSTTDCLHHFVCMKYYWQVSLPIKPWKNKNNGIW